MSETVKNGFGLCLLSYPTAEAVGNSIASLLAHAEVVGQFRRLPLSSRLKSCLQFRGSSQLPPEVMANLQLLLQDSSSKSDAYVELSTSSLKDSLDSHPLGNLFVVGQRLIQQFPTTLVVGLTARNSLQPLQRLPHQRPKPLKTVLVCAYCPTHG